MQGRLQWVGDAGPAAVGGACRAGCGVRASRARLRWVAPAGHDARGCSAGAQVSEAGAGPACAAAAGGHILPATSPTPPTACAKRPPSCNHPLRTAAAGGRYLNDAWALNLENLTWSQVTNPKRQPSSLPPSTNGDGGEAEVPPPPPQLPPIAGLAAVTWNGNVICIGGHTRVRGRVWGWVGGCGSRGAVADCSTLCSVRPVATSRAVLVREERPACWAVLSVWQPPGAPRAGRC